MSIYNALYGRDGHGVGPNEPEKKGFARFCQMVGRDLGQLLGTNLMVCVLCLPAALGVSLGVTLLSLPLTVVCSAVTGLLTGPAMVLLADCALRSLQNDPSQWLPRAKQTLAAHWKAACGFGCIGTLVLGLLCFVSAFVFEAAAQQGYYPGLAILVFLALDFLVLAVLATLCAAVLPLLFPVSVFWAVLFGFWLPGLAAMQTLFPVLRQEYGVEVRSIPRPAAPDKPLTAQEQKKRSRANWWYYNWGIVAVAAMVIVGVAYVAHGLLTTVDPDYTVAVVTAEALPDEAVQRLQTALADYAEDANGDGTVVVQVNNYTWSADAALTDMNGQMAGATQMNTDLANGESKIWILDDPEGFEQAYGALSEKLGAEWQTKLIPWHSQPALSGLELGSYNTAADGSQTVDIQSRFAGYSVAVFDASDALWQALNS